MTDLDTRTPLDPFQQGDTFDPATVVWINRLRDLRHLLAAIETAEEVVTDLETTGLDEHAVLGGPANGGYPARIVLASLTLPQRDDPLDPRPPTFVVPLSHPESPLQGYWRAVTYRIAEALREWGGPITNQNLKFDLRWIAAHTGIDLSPQLAWDTQVSSHLLDETVPTSLKKRAPATFGIPPWDDFDLSYPGAAEQVPVIDLGLYAARDTYWTWRLAVLHRTILGVGKEGEDQDPPDSPDEVEARRLGSLAVWCAMPTVATLTSVETRGMGLDVEWIETRAAELRSSADSTRRRLARRYRKEMAAKGHDPDRTSFAPTSLWFRAWAECAVEAGDLKVAALTPTGIPQWSKAVLIRQQRAGSEVAGLLLEHRQAVKSLEFLTAWLQVVTPDHRVHATYHVGRVVTGRLSASDPNVQQITKSLKPAFIPRPGYLIAELDYSQIELRAAAFVADCLPMKRAFIEGQDLHRLIAATITGKAPQDVTPVERQGGKAANFGFLYGQGADGFREYAETNYGVSFTPDEAHRVRDAFFERWDGMGQWHARQVARAHATGQVVSPIGRVRRLPDIHDGNPSVSGHAERSALNAPVQGFASDIMQIAAASIEGRLPGHAPVPGVAIIATVHDSIVVEVPEDDWQIATGRCMRRMLDVAPVLARMGCHLDVPLAVEASVSTRWGLGDVGVIT